jgi:hypothetical protein
VINRLPKLGTLQVWRAVPDASVVEVVQGPVEFVDTRNNKRQGNVPSTPDQYSALQALRSSGGRTKRRSRCGLRGQPAAHDERIPNVSCCRGSPAGAVFAIGLGMRQSLTALHLIDQLAHRGRLRNDQPRRFGIAQIDVGRCRRPIAGGDCRPAWLRSGDDRGRRCSFALRPH